MARRTGKAYVAGLGWVTKKPTQERSYENYEDAFWAFIMWVFRWYPDKACDIFRSPSADFGNEELLQRVMMRVYARKASVSFTGTRGMTKTNTKIQICTGKRAGMAGNPERLLWTKLQADGDHRQQDLPAA